MKVGACSGERDGRRNRTKESRNPDQEPDADAIRGVWTRIESEIVEFRGVTRAKVSGTFYFAVPFCRWYADIVFT